MKFSFYLFFVFVMLFKTNISQNFFTEYIQHDGNNRQYKLYIPSSYSENSISPIMFNFHGGNGTADGQIYISDMRNLADENNFIELLSSLIGLEKQEALKEFNNSKERIFYYASMADKFEGNIHNPPIRGLTLAVKEPIGVMASILLSLIHI